jgi:hypothetical protein
MSVQGYELLALAEAEVQGWRWGREVILQDHLRRAVSAFVAYQQLIEPSAVEVEFVR